MPRRVATRADRRRADPAPFRSRGRAAQRQRHAGTSRLPSATAGDPLERPRSYAQGSSSSLLARAIEARITWGYLAVDQSSGLQFRARPAAPREDLPRLGAPSDLRICRSAPTCSQTYVRQRTLYCRLPPGFRCSSRAGSRSFGEARVVVPESDDLLRLLASRSRRMCACGGGSILARPRRGGAECRSVA